MEGGFAVGDVIVLNWVNPNDTVSSNKKEEEDVQKADNEKKEGRENTLRRRLKVVFTVLTFR